MLPAPVSFPSTRRIRRGALTARSRTRCQLRDILRAPARLTNLSALLLVVTASFSILFHLHNWIYAVKHYTKLECANSLNFPRSIASTYDRPVHIRLLDHLVLVPGHGVWLGNRDEDAVDEKWWLMADFQKNRGRPAVFLEHVRRGVEVASQDANSLLIFSGGQTTPAPMTEAESYLRLAQTSSVLSSHSATIPNESAQRSTTEPFALDSYQNLLFALARFREYTGRYPARITIVGYAFKARRFEELHARALRWPSEKLTYVGVDLPDKVDEAQAGQGELENAFNPFTTDLYGCRGTLADKRRARNFHLRAHAYHLSAPELSSLFEWCPTDGTRIFPGPLPWDT